MTIAVRGFGLDIDSESSIVGYGLMIDEMTGAEDDIEVLESATIEQLYVVDMTAGKRAMRPGDWLRWRKFLEVLRRSRKIAKRKRDLAGGLELDFSRGLMVPA